MESLSVEDWQSWQREGFTRLPAVRVERDVSLPSTWGRITESAATVLLESAQAGRFTYLCGALERIILGQTEGAEIWSPDLERRTEVRPGPPLRVLSSLLKETKM